MLLAFDTATSAVTVALHDGSAVVAESTVVDPLRHGELLAPGITHVLSAGSARPRDLTGIAVGVGPGPFTGLRVGLVTARMMAFALDVPLLGVCTLDVVAAAVTRDDNGFLVATDARRKEVYWAEYDAAGRRLSEPAVDKPDTVAFSGRVAGVGAVLYAHCFPRDSPPEYPNAADLARLALAGGPTVLPAEPLYLRRPDVSKPTERKRVR